MKKSIAYLIVTIMTVVSLCGCKKTEETPQPAPEETTEAVTEKAEEPAPEDAPAPAEQEETKPEEEAEAAPEETAEEEVPADDETVLPPYEYPGPEVFYTVLYQYLLDEYGDNYEEADVTIPTPFIIAEDESDHDDIKIWGDFWINSYNLNGDILENVAGGSYPGLIHIKATDDAAGYEVTGMEVVSDGSDYDPTAKKIFGDHYDEFVALGADDEGRNAIRAQIIANYAAANDLSITAYQDYGWDPVTLPEENIDSFYSNLDGE